MEGGRGDHPQACYFWKITSDETRTSLWKVPAKFCFKGSKRPFWSFAGSPTPPGQPPLNPHGQLNRASQHLGWWGMFLLWCQQDLKAIFWNWGWLPPPLPLHPPRPPQPPAPSPRSGFKPVPSELPSCIRFLLELLNVTLEGAATPKASSSPPPFAVVGCESHAWRQSLGSQRGPCAPLRQTDKPAPREMLRTPAALPPIPTAPPLLHSQAHMYISPSVPFTKCAGTAAIAPFQSPCALLPV